MKITKALRVIDDQTLTLAPRYFLDRYIYDLAILREGREYPIIIIECDGKEEAAPRIEKVNENTKRATKAKRSRANKSILSMLEG